MKISLENGLLSIGCQQLQRLHSHDGIAFAVESWTPYRNRVTHRMDSNDTSSHSTLARHANPICKISALIIKTAGKHKGIYPLGIPKAYHLLAVKGIYTVICQKQKCLSQLSGAHLNAALVAIGTENLANLTLEITETLHKMGQRLIPLPCKILHALS